MQREFAGDLVREGPLVDDLGEVGVSARVCGRIGGCYGRWRGGDGWIRRIVGRACGYDLSETRKQRVLPAGEGIVEIQIAVDAITEANAAEGSKFVIEVDAEFAELLVVGIAEREDAVGEVSVAREMFEAELFVEWSDRVGCFPFAIGAGDDDSVAFGS